MKRISGASIAILTSAVLGLGLTLGVLALEASASTQESPAKPAPKKEDPKSGDSKAQAATDKVTVVFLGNATCPGDGKPVDRDKYVEVEGQRVYVCSEACESKLKKDSAAATAAFDKAYPVATPVVAKSCFCGKEVEKGQGTNVTFEGHKVALCCADCAGEFKKAPVTSIAIMMNPTAKDAKNTSDPVDGKPIDAGVVAIYKGHLVHFASYANAIVFEKDPDPLMAKLKLSS
jgi:YHS domain-containing protein